MSICFCRQSPGNSAQTQCDTPGGSARTLARPGTVLKRSRRSSLGGFMRPASGPPFRAEHIGSLVRPPRLLQARAQHAEDKLGRDELRAIEDDAIRGVVALQEEIGLNVVTDGEFRRGTYSDSFTSAGISGVQIELTEDQGWSSSQSHGHRMARRIPKVVDRI